MTLQQLFQQALTSYQQNSYVNAAELLQQITKAAPRHPAGWHLLALTLRKQGKLEESEQCFNFCLQLNPHDADVLNNFANLKRQQKKTVEAEQLFRRAIKLKPDFVDAWYNLGLLLSAIKCHNESIECLQQALQLQPTHKSALLALAVEYMHIGQLEEAGKLLEYAVGQYQNDCDVSLLYAQLLRKQGFFTKAIELALPWQQQLAAVKELALCYCATGNAEKAKQLISNQLELAPTDPSLLHLSAELGWQNADPDWLAGYQRALKQQTVLPLVYLEYANKLQKTADFSGAEQIVDAGLRNAADNGGLLLLKGYLRREAGDFAESLVWLTKTADFEADPSEALSEQVVSLLALQHIGSAIELAQSLCHAKPLDQARWALLAACYKQCQDSDRYRQLYDFEHFIRAFTLEAPQGFTNVADFNQQLLTKLHSLHTSSQHPLQQSLRQGTQTEDHLFYRQDPLLQQLQQQITAVVTQYITALPDDSAHPFLRRKTADFRYSGAWSVRLRQQGFHRNHYHGDGWISGCYYVSIPAAVNKAGSGWIKFGQPELGRHLITQPDYLIKPEAGLLVLFPSMMWHGTEPFNDEQYRVTVAFDIVPQSHED
ncbi:putative 2OG-Fe(II) oxygenase [Rheinheimera gaetbuli]